MDAITGWVREHKMLAVIVAGVAVGLAIRLLQGKSLVPSLSSVTSGLATDLSGSAASTTASTAGTEAATSTQGAATTTLQDVLGLSGAAGVIASQSDIYGSPTANYGQYNTPAQADMLAAGVQAGQGALAGAVPSSSNAGAGILSGLQNALGALFPSQLTAAQTTAGYALGNPQQAQQVAGGIFGSLFPTIATPIQSSVGAILGTPTAHAAPAPAPAPGSAGTPLSRAAVGGNYSGKATAIKAAPGRGRVNV